MRHRVVSSTSLDRLEKETQKLMRDGWRTIGVPALAKPADVRQAPYWVQAMYLSPHEIPFDAIQLPETHSQKKTSKD